MNRADGDRTRNVPAGTVVDTGITDPASWDFYLQSHSGLLGTSRSCHYTILRDDNRFTVNDLASITYNLCYTYQRAQRSVSTVTPAYYAHHACTRTKLLTQAMVDDGTASEISSLVRDTSFRALSY